MEFLYPKFDEPTHKLLNKSGVSVDYPEFKNFYNLQDYNIANDALVVLIRENIGYNNEWSYIKIIDSSLASAEYYNKTLYVLKSNLVNIGGKQSYIPSSLKSLKINTKSEEINPLYKEIFTPYIDSKNGFFSVRIQVDYEKILDIRLFNKILEEVYIEGVSLLLASRGFKSDNDTINNLKNKYYCFAYINKDLDLTTRRICEPLTFTVSIPLNFFNDDIVIQEPVYKKDATNIIKFTNNNFIDGLEQIISLLSRKSPDILKITYPDKIIENFIVDFEINSIRAFAVSANELMQLANSAINIDELNTTEYSIGLDEDLNLVSVNIKKYNQDLQLYEEIDFAEGLLAQCRLRGNFNNKRIFNYLLNINNMVEQYNDLQTIDYLIKYVKYPNVRLVEEYVEIDNIVVPPETVKDFRMNFSKDSEACFNLSDATGLINKTTRATKLADPFFNMFTAKDRKNQVTLKSITEDLKNNLNHLKQISNDFTPSISSNSINLFPSDFFTDKLNFSLSTVQYIAKRLNAEEILFTKILCYLKGTDPNAPEVAQILSSLPFEIINYLKYIKFNEGLRGAKYIEALEQGISFDPEFCNDEIAYFIKGLSKFLDTANVVMGKTISYTTELSRSLKSINGRNLKNPYQAVINSVYKTLYITLSDFIFEYLRDLLTEECDESILEEDFDNFFDPFSTHYPIDRFNNSENNNKNIIKSNRLKALEETAPDIVRKLTFGSDTDYTIDLIGKLLNDINCILTTTETINLLNGYPSEEIIVLIKNIIKNKYSKDPNNLSYLLNDDKLKLFFIKLGLKVDPEYIEKYSDTVKELIKINNSDVCTPEQFRVREEILSNKIPKELNTLADDTRRRVKKAKELIEKIKNGNVVYNISGLCPDFYDEELENLKDDLFTNYLTSLRSIFSNTLNTFTSEVNKIPEKYTESKEFTRKNSSGEITELLPYKTLNSNIYENLFPSDNTSLIEYNYKIEKNKYFINTSNLYYRIKTKNFIGEEELADSLLGTFSTEIASIDECSDYKKLLDTDPVFKRMIEEGRIIYEKRPFILSQDSISLITGLTSAAIGTTGVWALYELAIKLGILDQIELFQDNRNWDSIRKSFKTRDKDSRTAFSIDLEEKDKNLYDYIKSKGYVIFVSSEEFYKKTSYKQVNFRLVYYLSEFNDFLLLKEVKFLYQNDEDETKTPVMILDESLSTYTGEWISRNEYDKLTNPKININNKSSPLPEIIDFYNLNYPSIKYIFATRNNADNYMEYTNRVLGKDFIPSPPKQSSILINGVGYVLVGARNPELVFNITQTIVKQLTDSVLDKILVYEKVIKSAIDINKKGLFYVENNFLDKTKKVKVASTSMNGTVQYKNYYENSFVVEDDFVSELMNVLNKKDDATGIDYYDMNSYGYFIEGLYQFIGNSSLNNYIKSKYDPNQFIIYNKEEPRTSDKYGPFKFTADYFFESEIQNPKYSVSIDPSYVDNCLNNYQKISLIDYSNNIFYKNCNLYPHYLNLEYFLNLAAEMYRPGLCDTNLDKTPLKVLNLALARITIRTYITDQLIKSILFLSLLDKEDLDKLFLDEMVIDIMREHMHTEMNAYNISTQISDKYKDYYNLFLTKKIKTAFQEELQSGKINKNYVFEQDGSNKEINYYIRKEIKHFIKFCLENKILIPKQKSLYKEDISLFMNSVDPIIKNIEVSAKITLKRVLTELFLNKKICKQEFYTSLIYFLMTSTVDSQKRILLQGTKSELSKLFFSSLREFPESGEEDITPQEKPGEDIVKFISKIGYSNNPALLAVMNPDYSKYVTFFLESSIEETRSILLNSSMFNDLNIGLTRAINFSLSTVSGIVWSLMDEKSRNEIMIEAAINNKALGLLYKRMESAMSPIPDAVTSVSLALLPGPATWPKQNGIFYLIFDTIKETMWGVKTYKELEELASTVSSNNNVDPCETTQADTTDSIKPCSVETREKLIKEINKFEEDY